MLNLIYSGALTTILLGLAVLIQFEKNIDLNRIVRSILMLATVAYGVSFALFSEPFTFKSTILLRDLTLVFCVFVSFRIIRNSKVIFPILLGMLIFGMSNFGFNHIHDSFKISKFSVLKEANASTETKKAKKIAKRKKSELRPKPSKN